MNNHPATAVHASGPNSDLKLWEDDYSSKVESADSWYYFVYDDMWRIVATYRGSDSYPKEQFVYHAAGRGKPGAFSSYIDAVVLRDGDMSLRDDEKDALAKGHETHRSYCPSTASVAIWSFVAVALVFCIFYFQCYNVPLLQGPLVVMLLMVLVRWRLLWQSAMIKSTATTLIQIDRCPSCGGYLQ